jgi:hypothetical protein
MSTPGGAGASRGAKAKPTAPLKGSFPLDHFGECKHLMVEYTECMKVRKPPCCRARAVAALHNMWPSLCRSPAATARNVGSCPRSTWTAG